MARHLFLISLLLASPALAERFFSQEEMRSAATPSDMGRSARASAPPFIKSFSPIQEPQWPDRPSRPGDWGGESCLARVWAVTGPGKQTLIMYRHGARNAIHASLDGKPVESIALAEKLRAEDSKRAPSGLTPIDFLTSVSFQDDKTQWRNGFQLTTKKTGPCRFDPQSSKCVRAEGVLMQAAPSPGDLWRIHNPIRIQVEDSCAKHKNSNFLDARPFWAKIPIPH